MSFLDLAVHRYDFETQHAFVGDYSGQITLLKLEQNTCSVITTLKGHEGKLYIRLGLHEMPSFFLEEVDAVELFLLLLWGRMKCH